MIQFKTKKMKRKTIQEKHEAELKAIEKRIEKLINTYLNGK